MAEAHALLLETDIWSQTFASKPVEDMTRLDLGNLIYASSLTVSLPQCFGRVCRLASLLLTGGSILLCDR